MLVTKSGFENCSKMNSLILYCGTASNTDLNLLLAMN